MRSIDSLRTSSDATNPSSSEESSARLNDGAIGEQDWMNTHKIGQEIQEWMDELDIDKVHLFNTAEGFELQRTDTIGQNGEVWYAVTPQKSSAYEVLVYPDDIYAWVNMFDESMWPIFPENGAFELDEGHTYFIQVNFEDIDSPREYLFFISPRTTRISEHWNYYGDLFEESPSQWLAITPATDGTYNIDVEFEHNDRSLSFAIWKLDNGLKKMSLNADGNAEMFWGNVYFIEVRTSAKDFYAYPYTITIQLFDDEDDDFIYPDDEDYDYDNSYDPSEFEYID